MNQNDEWGNSISPLCSNKDERALRDGRVSFPSGAQGASPFKARLSPSPCSPPHGQAPCPRVLPAHGVQCPCPGDSAHNAGPLLLKQHCLPRVNTSCSHLPPPTAGHSSTAYVVGWFGCFYLLWGVSVRADMQMHKK
jgi:hypothetical protein